MEKGNKETAARLGGRGCLRGLYPEEIRILRARAGSWARPIVEKGDTGKKIIYGWGKENTNLSGVPRKNQVEG